MKSFLSITFSYIWKNKKEMLPQVLSGVVIVIFMGLIAQLPFSKSIFSYVFWLVCVPYFFGSFFRALAKTEKDNLTYGKKSFIIFCLPFLLVLVLFVIAVSIQILVMGLESPVN